jgi:hypothetical protein
VLLHRGDIAGLLAMSRESCELYPHLHVTLAAYRALLAAIGEREESGRFAREWHGVRLSSSLQPSNWMLEASCLAELAYRLEDRKLAGSVYDFLAPHHGRNVIVGQGISYNGPVSRLLGLLASVLGRRDDAVRCFEQAAQRARNFRAEGWVARVQIDHAAHLLRSGGEEDVARRLISEAGATARRIGAVSLQLEIELIGGAGA